VNQVFLDTVGVIAVLDSADQWHSAAEQAYQGLRADSASFVTTEFVLLECGNAAARRPYRHAIVQLRDGLQRKGDLIIPTPSDCVSAWRAYEHGRIGGPSIIDCVSFQVMRRLGLVQVFTNDAHFADAGFDVLF